jgi:hypothetical protein
MTVNEGRRSILLTILYCISLLFFVAAAVYIMGHASDQNSTKAAQHAAAAGAQNQ